MPTPFEHPWLSGLFHDEAMAEIWSADNQLARFKAFEAAWTRGLATLGIIPKDVGERVARGIEDAHLSPSALRPGMARDGVPIPALITLLREQVEAPEGAIHNGATSQDVIDTAFALSAQQACDLLSIRLRDLDQALGGLSARFGDRTFMARTRMQAANPMRLTERLERWRRPVSHLHKEALQLRDRIGVIQYGGATGDRSALGDSASQMGLCLADSLGLRDPGYAWHSERSIVVEYGAFLAHVTGCLGKTGQDICLMAQQGIDDLVLATGGGSSAMPHKKNPIRAELLVTLARYNACQLSVLHQAMVHEQERSGAAWMLEWMVIPTMSISTACAAATAIRLCSDIAPPPES